MELVGQTGAPSVLKAVRGLSRGVDAARDADEAIRGVVEWIRASIEHDAAIALAQPDPAGRLRTTWRHGPDPHVADPKRTGRRRVVFRSARPARLRMPQTSHDALAMFPLVGRDRVIGVLEILASGRAVDAWWDVLEIASDRLAATLDNLCDIQELRREADSLGWASMLGRDLVRAPTPRAAVEMAVRVVSERCDTPVAGWYEEEEERLALTAMWGLGRGKRGKLRELMPRLPRWRSLSEADRRSTERAFADIVGARRAATMDAGSAVLIAATRTPHVASSLEMVGWFLPSVLRSLAPLAERRARQLDRGIAWTAHELRSPLLGVRAALELVLSHDGTSSADRRVLRSSIRELELVDETTRSLLAWASGARPLRRRQADVVRVVEEVVESSRREAPGRGIVVLARERVIAPVDITTLRAAIGNILRNALAYGDPGTKVEVTIERSGTSVLLGVKDEGPEIPRSERGTIFDPFVRGNDPQDGTSGSGLGLYIARRVVEAHGGRIWLESDPAATTFYVQLPVERRRASRRLAS